jgi:glutathione S-transferase
MHLYHQPRSRSLRVLWALEEAGASYDLTVISREQKKEDWYLALNPLGQSPVMTDDEGPITQSIGLCLHVCDSYPAAGLIAAPGTHARALQYQWTMFAVTELEAASNEAAHQLWGDSPDQAIVGRALGRYAASCVQVERALTADGWLVGGAFSIADLMVGAMLIFSRWNELAPETPAIKEYVDRLEARPARQRAVAVTA